MLRWLKQHFIPHAGNEHRPHFLRDKSMRGIIALILSLELIVFIIPSLANLGLSGGIAAVLPAILGELTNQERQTENLPALSVSSELTLAAQMKAEDMASLGYFAHVSPEGKTPWHWIELVGYKYQYAGENLAVNFRDSEDVTAAWLQSPTHKANIVKANYTEMGTGIARGMYEGRNTVFVAQVYANPLPQSLNAYTTAAQPPAREANILGAEIFPAEAAKPALWQKLLASPRHTANILLSMIFIFIALALLIYVIIKMRNHHKDLLGNGLAALAIVGALAVANYYLSFNSMVVAESLDYALEDTL